MKEEKEEEEKEEEKEGQQQQQQAECGAYTCKPSTFVVWRQEAEVPGQPAHTNPSLKQNTQSPMSQSRSSDT